MVAVRRGDLKSLGDEVGEALARWDEWYRETDDDGSRRWAAQWVKAHDSRYRLLLFALVTRTSGEIAEGLKIDGRVAEALLFMARDVVDALEVFEDVPVGAQPCLGLRTLLRFIVEARANGELPGREEAGA